MCTRARSAARQRALGRRGEEIAAAYLERTGMRILERNWRCPDGEIDLVAHWGRTLVVIEVKTRAAVRFGRPLEAVDARERARLRRLGQRWALAHGCRERLRVDLLGVLSRPGDRWFVRHQRGVA